MSSRNEKYLSEIVWAHVSMQLAYIIRFVLLSFHDAGLVRKYAIYVTLFRCMYKLQNFVSSVRMLWINSQMCVDLIKYGLVLIMWWINI